MDTQSLREMAMATPRKTQDIATPFWPGTDGQIAIADMNIDDITALRPLAASDPGSYSAALVIKALVSKETGEQIFSDADRDSLKAQASVLLPVVSEINEFLGFGSTIKAVVAAAKNG